MAAATAPAPASTESCHAVTPEWALAQSVATAALRKAQAGVVYRCTWPTDDSLRDPDADQWLCRGGLSDSSRDLRQGLSVVEVFTSSPEAAVDLVSIDLAFV